MSNRREFIQQSVLSGMLLAIPGKFSFLFEEEDNFSYASNYIRIKLQKSRPQFSFFSTDSLGKGYFPVSPLLETAKGPGKHYENVTKHNKITWLLNKMPAWECKLKPKSILFRTRWKEGAAADPFDIAFSQKANHCTVLGVMKGDKQMQFPCILHFPGMGTFQVDCSDSAASLFYDAELTDDPYIKISLPAAGSDHPEIEYTFESVAIYPAIRQIENDDRYDGFKKNYINIFQFNPRRKVLSNNSTSDACAFTLFLYAEMARKTPPLTKGITAMDLIRNTLDEYFKGVLGYGMVGKPNWKSEYNSSDSYPSLVMAACYYVLETKDIKWAKINYQGIKQWAKKIIATDTNDDGIIEYGYSGNTGSWDNGTFKRPANWWDTIGFGHDDAYSNALAYRACILLGKVAAKLNKTKDMHYFNAFAAKLKSNYYTRFYNPETGVLGGWRSSDGVLHDYYFTFINSIAVCYDLVDLATGKRMMQKLLDKMKEVNYTDFRLGLPGNLVPIADGDYAHHDARWGYQHFQVYENGGATGCYVYYTVRALFSLGMRKEGEEILFNMLQSYTEGNFSGNCPGSTMTKDWKTWDGACWGYEGFLVDNYLALLNVPEYFGS